MSLNEQLTTLLGKKMGTAPRGTSENETLSVTRCLFGKTKQHISCLNYSIFRDNRTTLIAWGKALKWD